MTISDEDLEKMSEMFKARMREVIKPQFERRDAIVAICKTR